MRSLRPTLESSGFLDIGEVASNVIYSKLISQTNEFYFFNISDKLFIYFTCMGVLSVCTPIHTVRAWVLRGQKSMSNFPGTGVTRRLGAYLTWKSIHCS